MAGTPVRTRIFGSRVLKVERIFEVFGFDVALPSGGALVLVHCGN